MSLSIHLHGLHLDAQCGQTWHLSTQLRSGERTGRRLLWSTTLLLSTLLSDSQVSISLVIHGLWWTVSGQVKTHVMLTCRNGVLPITFLWLWWATDHEPRCWHVPINKIWRRTESTPRSEWRRSHMAGICSDCSTHEINTHTYIHPSNGPLYGTTRVSQYQKVKTNLDFTEARDSGISWAICKSAPRSRQPRQHPTTQFFTGPMPFLQPNQQRLSTEGDTREINSTGKRTTGKSVPDLRQWRGRTRPSQRWQQTSGSAERSLWGTGCT